MDKIYRDHLVESQLIQNDSERLVHLTAVLRSLLQAAVISTFEIASMKAPIDEIGLAELTERFCKPVDGHPLQILDDLIPHLRRYVNRSFLLGWFEATKNFNIPLAKQLLEWVEFRNKRPAHGVLDSNLTKEWSTKTHSLIENFLITFSSILPRIENDNILVLSKEYNCAKINFPLVVNNKAIVIIGIQAKKGIWKVKGQLLCRDSADEFAINLPEGNLFSDQGISSKNEFNLTDVVLKNRNISIFHNIPERQTDIFEGRSDEVLQLQKWMSDRDSRFCLVYGDGGYGKTTLVLEMLNQFLEHQFDLEDLVPSIISFSTAKMTKWTDNGLVHLTGIAPAIDECLRDLVRVFYATIPAEWYAVSGRALVDKVVGLLKEHKYDRDEILIIIDNSETLATNPQDVKDLGAFIKSIGKLVGRIIVTSRRREFIEATPIVVEGLSEAEAFRLLKRLASEYNATAIIKAGEPRLRKVANQLMCKPLLLEVLVKFIGHTKTGIDEAVENIFRKSHEDLLEFLYEDAWQRLNESQKNVFLLLINLSSPMDQATIGRACQEIGIQQTEFQAGLEETHFASVDDRGRTYSVELVEFAHRFFVQQFSKLSDADKSKFKELASKVDKYASELRKVELEYKTDRVAEAFRNEFARAAKIYADRGDIKNAIAMYKLAIKDDPLNSFLFDRFSWLLLNKANDFEYAKVISLKAIELDQNNCDAIVGLALVLYRLGDIEGGDRYIELARTKGRSLSFCLLRKAIARYHFSKELSDSAAKTSLLEEAVGLLEKAERSNVNQGGYDAKNRNDIAKYLVRSKRLLSSQRAQKRI